MRITCHGERTFPFTSLSTAPMAVAMAPAGEAEASIVGSLNDLAPARLGALLSAVRKQRTESRRDVARLVGTNVRAVRRCERGDAPAPHDMLAALAAHYGDDLTARFEPRSPINVGRHQIIARTDESQLGSGTPLPNRKRQRRSSRSRRSSRTSLFHVSARCCVAPARNTRTAGRRDVASQVGTTARELRQYETGATPVPHGILTALAAFYGEDLDSHFAHRSPFGRSVAPGQRS